MWLSPKTSHLPSHSPPFPFPPQLAAKPHTTSTSTSPRQRRILGRYPQLQNIFPFDDSSLNHSHLRLCEVTSNCQSLNTAPTTGQLHMLGRGSPPSVSVFEIRYIYSNLQTTQNIMFMCPDSQSISTASYAR